MALYFIPRKDDISSSKVGQYHVLVIHYLPDIGRITSIEFDQTAVCRIVTHYYKFKFFICEHRSFHPAYITQILVYKTDQEVAKCVALQAQYMYDTYGKFPATVPSIFLDMHIQAQ